MSTTKEHWEKVYAEKSDQQVSWYQEDPSTSLSLIESVSLPAAAPIIDVGGGNSNLADRLLSRGYQDISVLDISENALQRTRRKLGEQAERIQWIASDILDFRPSRQYAFWHDRATFHFLTERPAIERYLEIADAGIRPGGYLLLATFSNEGPTRCSGLAISQYSSAEIQALLPAPFQLLRAFEEDHQTPTGKEQRFLFTLWQKQQ